MPGTAPKYPTTHQEFKSIDFNSVSKQILLEWVNTNLPGRNLRAGTSTKDDLLKKLENHLLSTDTATDPPPALSANGVTIADPLQSLLQAVAIKFPDDPKAEEVAKFSFQVRMYCTSG